MARSMLYDSQLSEKFWSKVVNTVVYIRNRSPTYAIDQTGRKHERNGKRKRNGELKSEEPTPYGCYFEEPPSLAHIRPFGCNVWVHVLDEKRTKYESKTKKYIMLGYVVNASSIWHVWDPETQRQTIVTDCIFEEDSFGDPQILAVVSNTIPAVVPSPGAAPVTTPAIDLSIKPVDIALSFKVLNFEVKSK